MENKFNVLIIGEVILDLYNNGKVIQYEQNSTAPIFICDNQILNLGGAGNVAANVSSANMNAYICTIVNSSYAKVIQEHFKMADVSTEFLLVDSDFTTSMKYRYYENESILFRVDKEKILPIATYVEIRNNLINTIVNEIQRFDCIIISDYNKGLFDKDSIEQVLAAAQKNSVPTIVDPACTKERTYANATIIKLNKKELEYFTDIPILNQHTMQEASQLLIEKLSCQIVIVTCSNDGIFYLDKYGKSSFRTNASFSNAHVIGAGDTIAAYTAYGFLHNFPIDILLRFLSLAGELAVKK